MDKDTEKDNSLFDYISKTENTSYSFEGIIDASKVNKADHDLSKTHNFASKSLIDRIKGIANRDNIILYGLIMGEEPINIEQTTGNVKIPVINKDQIIENLKKIDANKRPKIAYIHISTIQMIMKSTFTLGIESPMEITLRDERISDLNEALIAVGKGNLKHGKIKFNLNHQVGMSLRDADLDGAITLTWKLLRPEIMKTGNHPFSVTWRINYALTNSHHSLSFKPNAKIEIDQLFSPLVQLESPKRTFTVSQPKSLVKPDDRIAETSAREYLPIKQVETPEDKRIKEIEQSLSKIGSELGLSLKH